MDQHPFASSPWPAEDGGPRRLCAPTGLPGLGLQPGERLEATSRDLFASTMCVLGGPGEVFVLGHQLGVADATSWVERIDPESLETIERSADLPGGPTWPGGIVAHPDGGLLVTFGRWCHRLGEDLAVQASCKLPRDRPYNSLVTLADGSVVMKDIGLDHEMPAELVVLDPRTLELRALREVEAPEPSVARLSTDGDVVYVVGDSAIHRFVWDGASLQHDPAASSSYLHRAAEGQTFGWDAVVALDSLWFLDNGQGTEQFIEGGTLRGKGTSDGGVWLHRAPLAGGPSVAVPIGEGPDAPPGIVANPPAVDPERRIVVGFDSANALVQAFDVPDDPAEPPTSRWRRSQGHGCHMIRYPDTGELVTDDHGPDVGDQVVVLDVETGEERGRVATGSPVQSVLFPCPGWSRDLYLSSFTTLARVSVS